MDEFDIYIRSFRAGGPERPELALRRVFGLDEEQAREFVASLPRVVKRRVPAPDRGRYAKALGEMGAELEFRRSPIQPIQAVAVKGVGAGQGTAPQPRQPGHILSLGDLLPEPGPPSPGAAARPAPVWPAPAPAAAPVQAQEPGPGPAPAASSQPDAVSVQAHERVQASRELGMAHTQRVEAAALPRPTGGDPPRQVAPATVAEPRRSWTVANTPAMAASMADAFAANPVKGPATATLRQQPAFGEEGPGPGAVPAAPVLGVAPPAAQPARLGTRPEVVEVRDANHAIASAEAASLAAGWQDPAPAAAPAAASARPARPLASAPGQLDAARAYSQASTSDSMKLDLLEAPRQPSWLVQESSLRQQVASAAPATATLDVLELSKQPAYDRDWGPQAADAGGAYDGDPAGGRWLLSLGGEADAGGAPQAAASVRAAPQAAASIRAAPQAAASIRAAPQAAASIRAAPQAAASIRAAPQAAASMRAAPQAATRAATRAAPHQALSSQRPGPGGSVPITNLPSGAPAARIESGRAVRPAGIPERPQRRTLSRALGMESRSLPFGIRLLLRVGLGVSAFLLLLTFRSCPLLKTDLQRELAPFEQGEAAPTATTELSLVQGEVAHTWIEAGDHQFRDPNSGALLVDKDPIRGLVSRLHRLGAPEVYVYGVQQVDLIVYAEGIDVVLPNDPSQRGAIFLEEARFHRLDAPTVPDTGQTRLRVHVP